MKSRSVKRSIAVYCLLALTPGCAEEREPTGSSPHVEQPVRRRNRSAADRLGTRFIPDGFDVDRAPTLAEIPIPDFPGATAIWGSSGRDDVGNIWFGVCATGLKAPSANLFSYSPSTNAVTPRGDVVTWMKKRGVYRGSKPTSMHQEGQMKIHSKIFEADDGFIYFASTDERGESAVPLRNPTWGGHLWRTNPRTDQWEHLLATTEGLIALSCSGRYVYALGYHDHVLYQYDTQTTKLQNITVGSYQAHVTRNFFADLNHHVYVPRVYAEEGGENLIAELVEFDENLREIGSSVMREYGASGFSNSHGLMGFTYLADGSILFTSWTGFLWHLHPSKDGPAELQEIGWFNPEGGSYVPTLITYDGAKWIGGLALSNRLGNHWVVRNLQRDETTLLDFEEESAQELKNRLLYGTNTRDNDGNFYLLGRYQTEVGHFPIMLRATIPTTEDSTVAAP